MDERAETKSIMLFPSDIARLQQIGKDFGLASLSAAVRFVLADWMRMKEANTAPPRAHLDDVGPEGRA